jgi:uncharacterized protein
MVFLGGPRQVGKTTLSQALIDHDPDRYLSWDDDNDRTRILKREFSVSNGILIFDEIHKYRNWRNYIKGLFDKRRRDLKILVTGSARLDLYRRGGDSLQGRYFFIRMYPLSVAELKLTTQDELLKLMMLGGFPEPYFAQSQQARNRWANAYRTRLIRDDLASLEQIRDMAPLELLSLRLPDLVGSPLSYNALREDLMVSHASVVRWCDAFERLYYIFRLYPFGAPTIKAVKKEAKHYQLDWSLVEEAGPRWENLIAVHLMKWCCYREDVFGDEIELRYFRDIEAREVDFVVCNKRKPELFLEVKTSVETSSPSLIYLKNKFPNVRAIQLALNIKKQFVDAHGIEHCSGLEFLQTLI